MVPDHRTMTFAQMLDTVRTFQREVHGNEFDILSLRDRAQLMRNYVLALNVEQVELLQEIPWKPWNYATSDWATVDWSRVTKEWVDCLVFLLDQALTLGLSAEVIENAFQGVITTKTKIQKRNPTT